MADNYFTDNLDLQFHLDKLDLREVLEILEDGYRYSETYPEAPRNYADAKDSYRLLMTVLGDICANQIAPRAAEAATEGAHFDDGKVTYAAATRDALNLLRQAELVSDPRKRMQVVLRMYRYRFGEQLQPGLNLAQIRGLEGVRVRQAYARASQEHGVPWHGRRYDRRSWNSGDPVNRALSAAHALLNGLCHAGIVSGGYSPALGFIHTGKQLSFVYDIADLYKVEVTIPLAFRIVAESTEKLEPRVRQACREAFKEHRLLKRILPDIDHLLGISEEVLTAGQEADGDPARPEPLWSLPPELILEEVEHGRDGPGKGADLSAR